MRTTTVAMILLAVLTTGCVTPSGIIDDFTPPQAQPTAETQRLLCDPVVDGTMAQNAASVVPCVVETATAAVGGPARPRPFDQRGAKRPIPPRRLR